MSFKAFFERYGDSLYGAYGKAKADGNDEAFADWVFGEYDIFLEDSEEYEVPYQGLCD